MNHIKNLKLKNTYYVMRHGQSLANLKGLIISSPRQAINGYGLSNNGKRQVREAIRNCKELNKDTIIYSSDFKRARQTAEIARVVLNAKKPHLTKKLRERYFGYLDKTIDKNYSKVWDIDLNCKPLDNIESVQSIVARVTGLVSKLEKRYKNKKILLVSHGDPLNILLTCMSGKDPRQHHKYFQLNVSEIKKASPPLPAHR